ncbi:unnamed protein product [Thelazia callipaeda]|uniref:Protein patched n=1 Tax=Thelazia callipaeda TaxID=103827 RepID=A0A0N5D7K1_THECL|nr:unnamed protein product [Thelazia callipaeda]
MDGVGGFVDWVVSYRRLTGLQCTQYSFCSERDREQWLERRIWYKKLVALKNQGVEKFSNYSVSTVRWRNYFCYEYQSVPFLMDNDSINWQISCLWNGNDMNGTCAPAPPSNKPVAYIIPQQWQRLLRVSYDFVLAQPINLLVPDLFLIFQKFRESIGCNLRAISEADKAQELYICTERCVQGGIGYMPVLLISATLMVSITLICFRGRKKAPPDLFVDELIVIQKLEEKIIHSTQGKSIRNTNYDILCTDSLTCNEHHRIWWLQMRSHVNNIIYSTQNNLNYYEKPFEKNYVERYSLNMRYILCTESQSMGFMTDLRSDYWPIRCLWTGSDVNGTCAPAPPSNKSVFYISPEEWRQKIILDELYVCKERCIQAGIGYLPSMFIMATLLVSFTLLLMT